jgi:prepilin-type N-terminal cleavage/methylation domain-containing protein
MRKDKKGFTLIELMIVIAIIAVIAAIAIPGLLAAQRSANERSAATSLKTLSTAEADFRSNDRDWNHVNDFWTYNVCGLYTCTSAAVLGNANANTTTDPAVKLIELSVASADSESSSPAFGEYAALSTFAVPGAKASYWYIALTNDMSVAGSPDQTYKQDTAGTPTMGSVHNTSKFGFLAYPDSLSAGKYVFIVNENNTIYRSATTGIVRPSSATPPGPINAPYNEWPSDTNLKSYWAKIDG